MTQEELKAREILIKMQFQSQPLTFEQAKKCALIAVDEVLKNSHTHVFTKYWQQVKHKIELL